MSILPFELACSRQWAGVVEPKLSALEDAARLIRNISRRILISILLSTPSTLSWDRAGRLCYHYRRLIIGWETRAQTFGFSSYRAINSHLHLFLVFPLNCAFVF